MAALTRVPAKPSGANWTTRKRGGGATGSQTWVRGAVLVAASGRLSEGSSDPTAIVGIAVHGVTSAAADATVHYIPAAADQEFIMSLDDGSDIGTGALALSQRYSKFGITEDSDGVWYVDINKTGAAELRVVVIDLIDEIGDTSGRVRVRFLQYADAGNTPLALTIYADV